ncbi:hypothetical protein ABLN64_06210, partial [Mycobacterium tuberculosis]
VLRSSYLEAGCLATERLPYSCEFRIYRERFRVFVPFTPVASFAAGCVVDSFEPLVVAAGDAEGFADGSVGFVGIAL